MRKTWTVLTVLALGLGAGCKNNKDTDKASDRVENARTNVKEQQKDVTNATNKEAQARRDVNQQQRELQSARGDLAQARAQYTATVQDKLARIDLRIKELSQSANAKEREEAAKAKAKRDDLQRKLDMASETAADKWDSYKKDVDDDISSLDHDLDIK
ncbi:MAG: hypothetical protein ACM31C_31945 [Acidobacteriota bacterium]